MFEFFTILVENLDYEIVVPPAERETFLTQIQDDFGLVMNVLSEIDVRTASSREDCDRAAILGLVNEVAGGADEVNRALKEALRQWVLSTAMAAVRALDDAGAPSSDTARVMWPLGILLTEHVSPILECSCCC